MNTEVMDGVESEDLLQQGTVTPPILRTQWTLVATVEGSHGIYEVNHIAWVKRTDRKGIDGIMEEEVLVSTADDGTIKIWTINR